MTINKFDSDSALADKIKSTLESLEGIGSGNVQVIGNQTNGFTIEFIGSLEGQAVANLAAKTIPDNVSPQISSIQDAQAGINEKQTITLFFEPDAYGAFTLALGDQISDIISFTGSDTEAQIGAITQALEKLTSIGSGNISVTYNEDNGINAYQYKVEFINDLARQDIPQLQTRIISSGKILNDAYQLDLSATIGTVTFTYQDFSQWFDISENTTDESLTETIQTTIESLPGIGEGNVSITGNKASGYTIEFLGDLSGQALSNLGMLEK